ncbi:MAG TPA: hypothetical protein VN617_11800 [Rhodoferax sp.]|nr:hypothetical protein [Rhodoferax sp.]
MDKKSAVYVALIEPIDFRDTVGWPDEELGRRLLAVRVGSEAESRGIDPARIPEEFAEAWVTRIKDQETDDVESIAIGRALRCAACGEFARAGKIWREWQLKAVLHIAALDEAKTGWRRQQAIARKPRQKKTPTARSETIAAMRLWRSDGRTLQDFLDAAGANSIERLSIKPANLRGVDKFSVECEAAPEAVPPVAHSTIKEWWAKAAK